MFEKDIEVELKKSKLIMRGKLYNPDATKVAFCWHGWLDNCLSFEKLAKAMPELKIYAMDIPGHGLSDHIPQGMNYFYHQFMLWAAEWIESSEENDIILLGHSLGATIFSMIIPLVETKVKHFISIDSLGPLVCEKGQLVSKMSSSLESWMNFKSDVSPIKHDEKSIVKVRALAERISESDSRLLCSRDLIRKDDHIFWTTDKRLRLKSPHYLYEEQVEEYFKANKIRNLIIYGKSGLVHKYNKMHRLSYLENCSAVALEGGHHLHLEHPMDVAEIIRDWLKLG